MKPYDSLAAINSAAQQIAEHIESLKADGLLRPDMADIRKLAIEQIRSEVSYAAVLHLADSEAAIAARTEKERLQKQERLEHQ